jgi:3-oxoacyl-(acyl-carrier-protein) synthase
MRKALKDAGKHARDISLIATFGSGSGPHDASELAALDAVFGDHLAEIPALAIKGAIGSNGAGSGAIDLAVAIKAMRNNTVPPSQNTGNPAANCRLRLNSKDPVDARIDYILGYSHAFSGGQCAALVIRRYEE